ncbi:MAG: hypothetical protein ABSG56_19870 [Bryobacteraceae bacterium]
MRSRSGQPNPDRSWETPFRENGQYISFPVLWSRVVGITAVRRTDVSFQLPEVALPA